MIDMIKHDRVTSYELRGMSQKLKSTGWNSKGRVKIHELQVQIHKYEFKFTRFEFKFAGYEFKSTSSRNILSMKTQVNSLKTSSLTKIQSLKSFSSWWGNSYVHFLVITSCFTFPLFHGTFPPFLFSSKLSCFL